MRRKIMKKNHNRLDPDGRGARTRQILNIPEEVTTSDYLVNNGFSSRTPQGWIKSGRLSLAVIEQEVIYETRHLVIEIGRLIDNYEIALTTGKLTEADTIQKEKAQLIWEKVDLIHRAVPALHAQREHQKLQTARASKPRKLTEAQHARIARQYLEGKENGEGYGLTKALASHYNVSTTTIRNIINKITLENKRIK